MLEKLPVFPHWEPLSLSHQTDINQFCYSLDYCGSDFSFPSLFSLDDNNSLEISTLHQNLLVRFLDSVSGEKIYSLLGLSDIHQTIETLLGNIEEISYLTFVPQITVDQLKNSGQFKLTLDEDNADYLYSLADWRNLSGKKFANFRRKVNQCQRNYQLKWQEISPQEFDLCWNLEKSSLSERSEFEERSWQRDIFGLEKNFSFWNILNLSIAGLFEGENLVAFAVWEELSRGTILIQHWRLDKQIIGGGENFFHQLALELKDQKNLNFGPDLGIAGLRQFKKHLQPESLMPKYIVRN